MLVLKVKANRLDDLINEPFKCGNFTMKQFGQLELYTNGYIEITCTGYFFSISKQHRHEVAKTVVELIAKNYLEFERK